MDSLSESKVLTLRPLLTLSGKTVKKGTVGKVTSRLHDNVNEDRVLVSLPSGDIVIAFLTEVTCES